MHRRLPFFVSFALLAAAASHALVTVALAAEPAPQHVTVDDPAVIGQWGEVMPWPDKAVHMVMLRTGKVLWYQGDELATYVWDPVTLTHETIPLVTNIFCAGQSTMADGRILVTGGTIDGSAGPRYTHIFDPITLEWTQGPDMRIGRYYPTQVALGDGRTLLIGGYDEFEVENPQIEIYVPAGSPAGTDRIDLVAGATFIQQYYPRMHLLPSGKLFHVGKDADTKILDIDVGTWTPVAETNHGSRSDGTAVMLPPGHSKFMIMSGGTNTVETIDLDDPTPTWSYTQPMSNSRIHANNLILPDGKVLVSGGEDGSTFIYAAEMYDPETGTWTVVDSMHTWRVYHSSAVLLPDGRCLWAGADGNNTAEIYSPPYLFRGPRPVIESAPSSFEYGDAFLIGSSDATSISKIALIRMSATTHSVNMGQRYVAVPFEHEDGNTLSALAPNNPNEAPPGFYMLFILNSDGVPSVAKIVALGGQAAFSNRPPVVEAGPNQIIPSTSDASLNGAVSDDGLPNPPGQVAVMWSKISGPGTVTFDNSQALQTTASFSDLGTYGLRLSADDDSLSAFDDLTVDVVDPAVIRIDVKSRVASGSDDAEELPGQSTQPNSSDLEMVFDAGNQTVGLRFTGMTIPQGATIYSAYLQFLADESQSEPTTLTIHGQDADQASTFTSSVNNISSRPHTATSAIWAVAPWTAGDSTADQRSPDISLVIQEIVDRPTWAGTSLALIISGSGHRTAESYEAEPLGAPLLCVEYGFGERENRAPIVHAGGDQTIEFGESVHLHGSATDDGLPEIPGAIVHTWQKESGPGDVSFTDNTALETEAGFIESGTYVLSLTSFDGELSGSDTVTVVVRQGCPQPGGGPGVLHEPAPLTVERLIDASGDDAEERPGGSISKSSGDLELVDDGGLQTVGLRFTGIDLPQGGIVTRAYIQFKADEAQTEATTLVIHAQDADSAIAFPTINSYLSTLPRTNASVTWNPPAWTAGDQTLDQQTPDLSLVFQELLDRPNWAGRSLAILISGTGHRTAVAYDADPAAAPRLFIELGCVGSNSPPSADAGPDQAIQLPASATLAGSVHDDGLPHPPDLVTASWAKLSGPGTVAFVDSTSAHTTASFSARGDYVLSLTAFDGEYAVSDSVNIAVDDPAAVNAAPVVNAGADQTIDLGESAQLVGSATDDGLPNPPGAVVENWRKVSGPGHVSFADSTARETEAGFVAGGTYVLSLTCFDGELATSDSLTIIVRDGCSQSAGLGAFNLSDPIVIDRPIASGADDVEQRGGGTMSAPSSDLEMVFDGVQQTIGLRFTGIDLPQGSVIQNAYIQFTADEAQNEATTLFIHAEDADSAMAFPTTFGYMSSLAKTSATVTWSPPAWTINDQGPDQRTPDLSAVIQELVDRPGWAGESIAFIITGTGHRTAEAYEGSIAGAARLYIEAGCSRPPTSVEPGNPIGTVTKLGRVFPTPGPGASTVQFRLARAANVKLEVYDLRGALVRTILNANRGPGQHTESWDGRDQNGRQLMYGVYLMRFAAAGQQETRKLVIIR